ncbi:hypothetical protein S83_032666, partial [Arachis hypogaea]
MRKVSEHVISPKPPKLDERDSLLEQIRSKLHNPSLGSKNKFEGCCHLGESKFNSPGCIGEFKYVDDHRAGKIIVELNSRLNKCGVISPRFNIGVKEIESWTVRLLPSRQ